MRSLTPIRTTTANLLLGAAICLGLQTAAADALAEMTPWATNEGGRMRIVTMPPEPDGTVRGALQIEPKDGWITYWKEPGEAGIPPQLTFSHESGITSQKMSYPVPKLITNGDVTDIGYDRAVAFPFALKLDNPTKAGQASQVLPLGAASIDVSAFIGICRNICIPFQAEFSLPMKAVRGTPVEEAMILNAASAALPSPPANDFAVTDYAMVKGGKVLRLTLRLPDSATAPPQVVVTGPEGHVLFESVDAKRQGHAYTLDMPVGKLPDNYDISGKRWGILATSGSRSMETSIVFD
ncbi:Thiol-disulfide interchange protein, contains DsbC and DsbD domains [Rhizobium sp. NFR12]|nr:Thiol-disulfide interchange protein, contains DsbC and DsbD domains [Rhizobium sp. NFR12]